MSEAEGDGPLDAGVFSTWLEEMRAGLVAGVGVEVPCGGCTACCTASQFVHVGPDETDTLARIPKALLFAAPQRSKGHFVLGYDERGHCPMLVEGQCTIYDHRPRACRTYDCRVFAATAVEVDEVQKRGIAERVRRWRFRYPTSQDRDAQKAVRAAADFLAEHAEDLEDLQPANPSRRAAAAVTISDVFVNQRPDIGRVRVALGETRGRPAGPQSTNE